jgi:virginiamycin A acetyltransferase
MSARPPIRGEGAGRRASGASRTPRPVVDVAEVVARLVAAVFVLRFRVLERAMAGGDAFRAVSESLALLPGPLGIAIRRAAYGRLLSHVGRGVSIGFGTVIAHRTTELADDVYVGRYCLLGDVRIGEGTLVADFVRVVSGVHGTDPERPIREQASTYTTIHVGADCWLANGALVLADVGARSVVGAGSVVTRPVAEGTVVAGNPARVLRLRAR